MIYTVVWIAAAERRLATLWINAARRQDVTAAADEIDRLLRRDPQLQGESRPDGMGILLVAPLGVKYKIDEPNRVVHVLDVWHYEKRKKNAP